MADYNVNNLNPSNVLGEGGHNSKLYCQFFHEDLSPRGIRLPLGVNSVTWSYNLITNPIDTYGGQVIQILGVNIKDLVIKGQFAGPNPQWGVDIMNDGSLDIDGRQDRGEFSWAGRTVTDIIPWRDGLQQMADWFHQYFTITTQGSGQGSSFERYDEKMMLFTFPARGWSIYLRPTKFPDVIISNENIAPEWRVEADFVEDAERDRTFISDVEKVAFDKLDDLKVGIGFRKRNPFSEFISKDIVNVDAALKIVKTFQDSVQQGLTEADISELITNGMSYPAGTVYTKAGIK